jgi:uncharacterized protein with HEPN domain
MKDDKLYLSHILEAVDKIFDYTKNGQEEFMNSPLIQDAVIRNFEIIGEATKQLSEELYEKNHDLPWSDMARFRDILIHHYMGVDLKRIWNVVESHLPKLRSDIQKLL